MFFYSSELFHSGKVNIPRLIQILLHSLHQCTLRNRPNHRIHLDAILEHHHRGDGANAILGGHTRTLIRVQLHRPQLIPILCRQLVDNRRNHSARPAPRRPKVNQHRHRGLQHELLPRRIVHGTCRNGRNGRNGRRDRDGIERAVLTAQESTAPRPLSSRHERITTRDIPAPSARTTTPREPWILPPKDVLGPATRRDCLDPEILCAETSVVELSIIGCIAVEFSPIGVYE